MNFCYFSQAEFLKDCQRAAVDRVISSTEFEVAKGSDRSPGGILSFFTYRPFIVEKTGDSVLVEFYKISAQDIQSSLMIIGFCLLFMLASLYGIISTIFIANTAPSLPKLPHSMELYVRFYPLLSYSMFALFSCYALHFFFVKKIVEYKENVITVGEMAFGRYWQLFSIDRQDLLPLEEKQRNTQVPGVANAALLISRRGKYREIAGHLLPEAMTTFKEVYDRFRTSSHFNSFYIETKPVTLGFSRT